MRSGVINLAMRARRELRSVLLGPHVLAFMPALLLAGYWFGGEGLLIYMTLLLPAVFALAGLYSGIGAGWPEDVDGVTGLGLRKAAVRRLDQALKDNESEGTSTAALAIRIDDFRAVESQFGARACATILRQAGERLKSALREGDTVARIDGAGFAIALQPVRRVDLESLIQLSARLQSTVAEPYSVDATRVYVTASVGFCTPDRATSRTGQDMLGCAEAALSVAAAHGSASIRAFTPEIRRRVANRAELSDRATLALENDEISAWFQPQLCTRTGAITGFEALARWEHPEQGVLPPSEFLPVFQANGLMERLSEVMLHKSLAALREWDRQGLGIPAVAVNFSTHELRNPKLCDKLRWELDRFDLGPDRLIVEILEDVVAESHDDVIARNIAALSEMGCRIDLDDFGTGHASIASIRRFAVKRVKIDKSFVARLDRDRDQQNMVAAVLTMADRLGLDTLAEGVETVGEHNMLLQLGCGHVQGFSIARPMPVGDVSEWVQRQRSKLSPPPEPGRKVI